MRKLKDSILLMIDNRDRFKFSVLDVVRRYHLVEAVSVVGAVTVSVMVIAMMLENLLGDVRSNVQASMDIEANDSIRVTDRGGEMVLGQFKVVSTLRPLQLANSANSVNGKTGENNMLQIVEMDAMAVVNSLDKQEIVQFHARLQNHTYRIRELFDQTIRKSTRKDFQDPDLTSLRHRIRTGMNRLLKTDLVGEVIFSHFRTFRLPPSMYSYQPERMDVARGLHVLLAACPFESDMNLWPHAKENGSAYQDTDPRDFDLLMLKRNYFEEFASRSASFLKYSSTA